jgi:hypothetical protein
VINVLPLTIESMVALLLLLTILYCVRLNRHLTKLRSDESTLRATIAELITATETAERAIAGLKATVTEADATLGERLRTAERYSADIIGHTKAGAEVLNRLVQIAGVRVAVKNGTQSTPDVRLPAPETKPAMADPQAIMAAAQAFAERARARVKGRAA